MHRMALQSAELVSSGSLHFAETQKDSQEPTCHGISASLDEYKVKLPALVPGVTCGHLLQDSEELHAHPVVQESRFPTPSSGFWGLQESPDHVNLSLPQDRFRPSSSNPWGLKDTAFPVMEISRSEHAFEGNVTYTPVEDFQPLPAVSTQFFCCPSFCPCSCNSTPSTGAAPLQQWAQLCIYICLSLLLCFCFHCFDLLCLCVWCS